MLKTCTVQTFPMIANDDRGRDLVMYDIAYICIYVKHCLISSVRNVSDIQAGGDEFEPHLNPLFFQYIYFFNFKTTFEQQTFIP